MSRWHLADDGAPFRTASSYLVPVTRDGSPAMLKVTSDPDEIRGNHIMTLWDGQDAATVLEYDRDTNKYRIYKINNFIFNNYL